MSKRLWDKGKPTSAEILAFTVGDDYLLDERLVEFDVLGSKAHARMLAKCGHISQAVAESLCVRLDEIAAQHKAGEWHITLEEEDAHTALEHRLGAEGEYIHLGRSRNDQVLCALRLYYKAEIDDLAAQVTDCAQAISELGQTYNGVEMPGYTHLQRAMPSSVSLWAEAYASELLSNSLGEAKRLANQCPLGSAAGYGVPGLHLDREFVAEELGFDKQQELVTACQLSRGKAEAALAFALVCICQDLGRFAADVCLMNSAEFGFVELPSELTTGSSIMPQKRNPDVFELVRGHSAQAAGYLSQILAITAKSTFGYHRDLQLIKKPLFSLVDLTHDLLGIVTYAAPQIKFKTERLAECLTPELYATEQAVQIALQEGLPFREAYRRVGKQFSD